MPAVEACRAEPFALAERLNRQSALREADQYLTPSIRTLSSPFDLLHCALQWCDLERHCPRRYARGKNAAGLLLTFIKQYVRDQSNLRTESATNNVTDYGVGKAIGNLPALREKLSGISDRYLDVQQDILETFVDRGELLKLTRPTVLCDGKRIPGLKLDHPRQLALMQALVRFSHIAAGDSFSTAEIHSDTAEALGRTTADYTLASLRYDLSKLRAKGLVERLAKSRRYRLTSEGYRICLVYLKLFEKLYAPLTSGLLKPFTPDANLTTTGPALLTGSIAPSPTHSIDSSMLSTSKPPKGMTRSQREPNSR